MVQAGAIRSRQKVGQLLAEILGKGSQWRFRSIAPCATFATHIREFFECRNAVLRALGFQPWCQRRSILFFYNDLTAAVTCWSPHASSMGGRSSRIRMGLSIRFSRWQPQPPGRLKDRRVVNPPAAAPRPLLIVAKGLTPHWRTFRRREHLSGYRSRQARVRGDRSHPVLAGNQ